jgi:carbonic anhydrase
MSVIDEVRAANEIYSRNHELRKLTPRPERRLAVLTCMDTRLSIRTLGLKTGDAHIIRNAGGIVTEDTLRSLVVSHYLLGTEEIMVINHTDCGLMHTSEQDLRTRKSRNASERPLLLPPSSTPSKTSKKMFVTNCKSFVPIPGFPRVSLSAASSTTSPVDVSAK